MLDIINKFVSRCINNLEGEITIESVVIYEESKLEYALSIENWMASITILSDFTYDFFIIEIKSEEIKANKTKNFKNIDMLFNEIEDDLRCFTNLKN